MIKEQVISKFFTVDNLNNKKYEVILQKAKDINLFKNQVSQKIHKDLLKHLEMSKFDFIHNYAVGEVDGLNGKDKEYAVKSQCCSVCGYISKENRKTQETFKCINCNNELNADYNSSINIKRRVTTDVLRTKLLSFNEYEWNCKSVLRHSAVKNILTDYFAG